MEPVELHQSVQNAFNAKDVDGLVELYEPDAILLDENGEIAVGVDAIREAWSTSISFGGTITVSTRFVVEQGDIALLSNQWTFTMPGVKVSSITAEVARRRPDGSWRYIIDNPYAAAVTTPVA